MERTAKQFVNWTNEDFSFKWDGVPYEVKAGQSMNLPDYLADHAAKHLTDREMQKDDGLVAGMYSDLAREPFLKKCFGEITVSPDNDTAAEVAALNQEVKPVNEVKPVEKPIKEVKPIEPAKEEVFEGLNDETPKKK